MRGGALLALLLAGAVAVAPARAQCRGGKRLQRSLEIPTQAALFWRGARLRPTPSDVLTLAGVWTLRGDFIAGLELRARDLKEPVLDMPQLPVDASVARILGALLARLPGYTCRIVAPGFVNIRPSGAASDRADPLNRRMRSFRWRDLDAVDLFEHPDHYFVYLRPPPPRLAKGQPEVILGFGPRGSGAPVPDGAIGKTTLLGLFNRMALIVRHERLEQQEAAHSQRPGLIWTWFCIEGREDLRTGLRKTFWSAMEMAPVGVPRPPPPVLAKPRRLGSGIPGNGAAARTGTLRRFADQGSRRRR